MIKQKLNSFNVFIFRLLPSQWVWGPRAWSMVEYAEEPTPRLLSLRWTHDSKKWSIVFNIIIKGERDHQRPDERPDCGPEHRQHTWGGKWHHVTVTCYNVWPGGAGRFIDQCPGAYRTISDLGSDIINVFSKIRTKNCETRFYPSRTRHSPVKLG